MRLRLPENMSKKRIYRTAEDIREHPCYSVSEAAHYLGIPKSTLHKWIAPCVVRGKKVPPLIKIANPQHSLLSFYNIVEAHVLVSTRRRDIPMAKVRKAVEWYDQSKEMSLSENIFQGCRFRLTYPKVIR